MNLRNAILCENANAATAVQVRYRTANVDDVDVFYREADTRIPWLYSQGGWVRISAANPKA